MSLLKEDGSLDIERINKLPIEEYMKEIGTLTEEQYRNYLATLPLNESKECTRAVEVDYTLEDEFARGGILFEDLINKLRGKHEKRCNG